ncbi:YjdJ family protein [Halobacillus litoralis]|uniref:YjdJ family protein n=1 Tax=Halobacillus litoralis TaxID=45668 RepID=UPI001CD5BB4F|nr:YjdJ family protein [Halobacillus litoralis]MCA0970261.1 YjdJ family protein [Halobacillus litoralis]
MMTLIFLGLVTIFAGAALAAWYEGSALLDRPWEWPYSTPFSHWEYGEVRSSEQISELDFFVYAVKFNPFYPGVMSICIVVFVGLIGYQLVKSKPKAFALFLMSTGLFYFLISVGLFQSHIMSGGVISYIYLMAGVVNAAVGTMIYLFRYNPIVTGLGKLQDDRE